MKRESKETSREKKKKTARYLIAWRIIITHEGGFLSR